MTPGLHVNSLIPFYLSLAFIIKEPSLLITLIVANAITHTYIDFIPSTFFGIPDDTTAMGVLPSHRMVVDGKGYEIIKLTAFGSLFGMIFAIIALFPVMKVIKQFYHNIVEAIPYILIVISAYMLISERDVKKIAVSAFIFLLSGMLGIAVIKYGFVREPFLPVLSGLFGVSTLLLSLAYEPDIKEQVIDDKIKLKTRDFFRASLSGTMAGVFVGVLPGIGNAQATYITKPLSGEKEESYLVAISSVNTANAIFSILSLYMIGKGRSGAAIAISKLLSYVNLSYCYLILSVILLSGSTAVFVHLYLGKRIAKRITKLNYRKLSIFIILLISLIVFFFTSFRGILVLTISTLLGVTAPMWKVKRSHLMGAVIIPILLS